MPRLGNSKPVPQQSSEEAFCISPRLEDLLSQSSAAGPAQNGLYQKHLQIEHIMKDGEASFPLGNLYGNDGPSGVLADFASSSFNADGLLAAVPGNDYQLMDDYQSSATDSAIIHSVGVENMSSSHTASSGNSGALRIVNRFASAFGHMMPKFSTRRHVQHNDISDGMQEPQAAAVDLLVIALVVSAATPTDCIRLSQAMGPIEHCALKRLAELAVTLGLESSGQLHHDPVAHAQDFLRSADSPMKGNSCAAEDDSVEGIGERTVSGFSLNSKRSSCTQGQGGDMSATSFADFSRRAAQFRIPGHGTRMAEENLQRTRSRGVGSAQPSSFLEFMVARDPTAKAKLLGADNSKPFMMDLAIPAMGGGVASANLANVGVASANLANLGVASANPGGALTAADSKKSVHFAGVLENTQQYVSENGLSAVTMQSAATYHSCDAVLLGEDGERELVQADVINLGGGQGSPTQVRIAFRSQCLRTQNEWQRNLLTQQRSLMQAMSTKLEDTQQVLRTVNEVQQEEKELLRDFRKIVTREVDVCDKSLSVEALVVETQDIISKEIAELCQILDFPCRIFNSLTAVKDEIKLCGKDRPALTRMTSLSSNRSSASRSSNYSVGGSTSESRVVGIVFLGSEWLTRELPPEWKKEGVYVVLTSQPEEFEEIGRTLFASGKDEILKRLRSRGISEYLLHPLSLEGLRQASTAALRVHFGHDFLLTKVVGRGSTSVVYRAKRIKDGGVYALKETNMMRLSKNGRAELERETELLRTLKWPSLMELVDAWFVARDSLRYLLMPLLDGGDIGQHINAAKTRCEATVSVEQVTNWYAQTLHGLSYLHSCGVLHRDLKPGNLLLGVEDCVVHIADLGSARQLPGRPPHPKRRCFLEGCGACTPLYAAPESVQEVALTASDMWAVGASFYEMLTLSPLFSATSRSELWELVSAFDPENAATGKPQQNTAHEAFAALQKIIDSLHTDTELGDDIRQLLRSDPLARPSAASLASRPSIMQRIWKVVSQTAPLPEPEKHLEEFNDILRTSREAEDLDPPSICTTYPPGKESVQSRRAKHRRAG